jgi:nucleotide-binding universal stress UspA family protein
MRRVAVATDFSEQGSVAVERAVALAEANGAELLFLYAVEDDRSRPVAATVQQAHVQLLKLREACGRIRSAQDVVVGDIDRALLNAVEQAGADLLVVGDHQRAAVVDLFRDTTVERLARFSRIPVLVARIPPSRPYQRAMLGLESDEAGDLVRAVDLLGPAAPGQLTGLHAYDAATRYLAFARVPEAEIDAYHASIVNGARTWILAAIDPAFHARLHLRLEEGDPEAVLLNAAAEDRSELTVVSTHARRRLSRVVLGSVSSELIRRGTTDLLIVPRARSSSGSTETPPSLLADSEAVPPQRPGALTALEEEH